MKKTQLNCDHIYQKVWSCKIFKLTSLLLFIAVFNVFGQQNVVTGVVRDNNGNSIPGVNVIVVGTTVGTMTDMDGRYSVNVPAGGTTLQFSFIGMESQNVTIGSQRQINVTLRDDAIGLEEVVVIGYGTIKRRDLTGSVGSVSEERIAERPVARLDQAMVGAIPGLDILSSSANPGSGTTIVLRGNRSFRASNDPLIILDGMPFYGNLNDVNPADIQSVDVMKDASSTAIYGSRGANGVIIVTTKRGAVGRPSFVLNSYAGPEIRYGNIPVMNGPQYAAWAIEAVRSGGGDTTPEKVFDPIELPNYLAGNSINYQDYLFQNGFQQSHQLSVRGGSEAVKYNITGGFLQQEGIMPKDIFKRISLNTNLDVTLSSKVTAGASIQLSNTIASQASSRSAFGFAFNGSPLGRLRDENGNPVFVVNGDGLEISPMADYWFDSHLSDEKAYSAFITAYGDYKILPYLSYRINLGTTARLQTRKDFSGYYSMTANLGSPRANISDNVRNFNQYTSTLTYNKTFNDAHTFVVTGIHEIQTSRYEAVSVRVQDIPYETSRYHNIGSAGMISRASSDLVEWALHSFAGRINYSYNSKYLASATLRYDGASQLAPGYKWGAFPSGSLAWRISDENFMSETKNWLRELKLRVSYGVTGNQSIDPYQTMGSLKRTNYSFNNVAAFGYAPETFAIKNLKWERTAVSNIGLDFSLIRGRISGNIDVYNTDTYDLLMYRKLPVTTGFDQVLANVGKTNNKGVEIGLRTINVDRGGIMWTSDVSFYTNRSKIVELYAGKKDDVGSRWFIGYPIQVYYDYEKIGIWQLGEAAEAAKFGESVGQIKVKDQNLDNKHNSDDMIILGSMEPDFVANLANNVTYKNWDLGISMYFRIGGMVSISNFAPYSKKRYNKLNFDYWTPENPTNDYPRPNQLYEGSGLWGSTLTYRDASYIRVQNLNIGYKIPASITNKVNLTSARLYASVENPWYWTKSELKKFNMRPETPSGRNSDGDPNSSLSTWPATRLFIVGVNLSF